MTRRTRGRRTDDGDPEALAEPLVLTTLAPHPRREGRVIVAINGVGLGAVTIDLVGGLSLGTGRTIDRSQLRALVTATRRTALLDRALDMLASRSRSTRDLRIRLRRLTEVESDIGWVTERLAAQGYLDDAAYARQLARARLLSGGVSRRRVVSELRQRGIGAETAATAIDETLAEVELDERGAALEAARRRMRALRSVDPATRRRRLYSFLARRGYETAVVQDVLRELDGGRTGDD